MADNTDDWEEISSQSGSTETHDFDAQPILVGVYTHLQENVGPNKSRIYDIEVEGSEEPVGVWGSIVLDDKMDSVAIGSLIKIEYLGKVQGKTSKYKDWKVFAKKSDDLGDVA